MENPFDSSPRTFVVDDDEAIAKMLAVILQMHFFNAMPFFGPEAALEAARQEPPDFLISDVVMPGMDGIELAIAMRGLAPDCKVLLFSGQVGARALIEEAKQKGHDFGMVEKPIQPKLLVEALHRL